MPVYEYLCDTCGAFTALRSLADYAAPAPCPDCAAEAPRALLTAPAFAGMPAAERKARATNEKSAHEPRSGHRHGPGCGCGDTAKPATGAPHAARGFPDRRPWMLSH